MYNTTATILTTIYPAVDTISYYDKKNFYNSFYEENIFYFFILQYNKGTRKCSFKIQNQFQFL